LTNEIESCSYFCSSEFLKIDFFLLKFWLSNLMNKDFSGMNHLPKKTTPSHNIVKKLATKLIVSKLSQKCDEKKNSLMNTRHH